ncbi:MAG: hypothetical protein K2Y37_23085 [Pirellulales bacterium]|nr:hypothetical protein [Pirellulales bacterium]
MPTALAVTLLLVALSCPLCDAADPAAAAPASAAPSSPTDGSQPADKPARLIEKDPFDQLVLKDGSTLDTRPLDLPERRMPTNPRPGEKLRLRLVSEPEQLYEVPWREVADVKFFEQLVLAEAERLLAAGELDEAYEYYDFLERNYVGFAPLAASYQKFLLADAAREQERGNLDYALVLFNELAARNTQAEGLDAALGQLVDRIVARDLERQDYRAAQAALAALERRFAGHEVVVRRQREFADQANTLANRARQEFVAKHFPEANDLARRAAVIWPASEAAQSVLAELADHYPLVVVGVMQPAASDTPDNSRLNSGASSAFSADDWSALRVRRLLARELSEFRGPGPDGGEYLCPVGEFATRELGKQLVVQVRPGIELSPASGPLDAFDIVELLLARADPRNRSGNWAWAELLARVAIIDPLHVQVDFQYAHLRPMALLNVPISRRPQAGRTRPGEPPILAGYRLGMREAERTQFLSIDDYFAARATSPREIVERNFTKSAGAIDALERGEIVALDRVNPWDLPRLQAIEGVVVQAYAVPTVHCLVVNARRPLLGQRTFRRGLSYALHREAILNTQLLRGATVPGCQTLSGPFPRSYAYNERVAVRGYEPRLAMLLAEIGQKELEAAKSSNAKATTTDDAATNPPAETAKVAASPATEATVTASTSPPAASPASPTTGATQPAASAKFPELVLVHPADEVARLACRAIQRQLALIKIPVRLVALEAGDLHLPADFDLAYVELQIWEPLVDAERIFGAGGLVPLSSPHVQSALGRLRWATDWAQARETLWELHALSAEDAALIPLWQLTEHCALGSELSGVGMRPATLYQDIEDWRIQPKGK